MNKASKVIIFRKCNLNYIYFLLYTISYIIILVIEDFLVLDEDFKNRENQKKTHYYELSLEILNLYIANISNFIAIIPYFIRKKLLGINNDNKEKEINLDRKNTKMSENKEQIELIYNDFAQYESEKRKNILMFYVFLVAAFDFLKDFSLIFFYIVFPKDKFHYAPFNGYVILDIILQFISSYLILKIHFYKLQYCSLYLNVAIFFSILIFDLLDIFVSQKIQGKIYIIYPFYIISYCLGYVYGKKAIILGYMSIYLIIIYKGVIKIILVAIFSSIVLIVKIDVFIDLGQYFSETKFILLIIAKVIANFFNDLFFWLIIDRFSPNYTPLILLVEEVCNFVEDLITKGVFKDMPPYKYVRILLYIISFIGVIIHNEIVVINICGLGSDTKYFLEHILKDEEEFSCSDNPNILKRYDSFIEMNYQNLNNENNERENSNDN